MTHQFKLEIELREPMALTDGSSDGGGGHESLMYIPGTSILGACVSALGVKPGDALFAKLYLAESTRFLNAYPALDGTRTLPRALTFRIGKTNTERVMDSIDAHGAARNIKDQQTHFEIAPNTPDAMKATREVFVNENAPAIVAQIHTLEQVHVGIDRGTRTAEEGVLFNYESIATGTQFQGMICTEDTKAAEFLTQVAAKGSFNIGLGRSRSAGYGSARAKLTQVKDWREATANTNANSKSTIITLLSDYVPHLETAPIDSLRAGLALALGVDGKHILAQSTAIRTIRGFRGVWGLPRPPRTALAKGSVFVINEVINMAQLDNISANGIGARRNEGFGRLIANWSMHGFKTSTTSGVLPSMRAPMKLARPKSPRAATVDSNFAMNNRRDERRLRHFIDAAISSKQTKEVAKALAKIPPAQLGNLRAAMASSMTPSDIAKWFQSMSTKTAGERWKRTNVPSLKNGDLKRNGLGFVWSSIFGGTVDGGDHFEQGSQVDWKKSVKESLCPLVQDTSLHDVANKQFERAMRLFVISLCSEVTRTRHLSNELSHAKEHQ